MKHTIFLLPTLLLAGAGLLQAHPGVGIVMDRHGNVFYTDLAQVWRIAADGTRSIAVANVQTHELALDSAGNLIGEEIRGVGGDWQHRVWQRSPDGRISTTFQSPVPWAPSGMLLAPDGTLWILEFDPANRVQVRRIGPRGETTVF